MKDKEKAIKAIRQEIISKLKRRNKMQRAIKLFVVLPVGLVGLVVVGMMCI